MPVQDRLNRLPPHDERAERQILASLMRWPDVACPACLELGVETGDFYFHRHQLVFFAAWELVGSGCGTAPADVYLVLRGEGGLPELGHNPALWLAEVYGEDVLHGVYDALESVRWLAARREVIHRATEALRDAHDGCRELEYYERLL